MINNNIDTNNHELETSSLQMVKSAVSSKKEMLASNIMTVYLFCPYVSKQKVRDDFTHFFAKELNDVISKSQELPVFFNIDSALEYGRFLSNHFLLLKAFVSDTAIVGQSQALYLKKNILTQSIVHGCYPSWGNGQIYYRNPTYKK